MSNILVVTGSARPNSVNQKVVPLVVAELEKQGATPTIADLTAINLPFFDASMPPTAPGFAPDNEPARQWTQMVADADGVVFVTPEYNHTLTPIQLNAMDWIGKEWNGKRVALVGYGWNSGASQAHATAREVLSINLKAKIGDTQTNLHIPAELTPDGSVADSDSVNEKIAATITELLAA